jgi:hypothetical protein
MPKPLSFDLRLRVLAAVDAGLSCRQAAERFGVSASSAIRWAGLSRGGACRSDPGGARRSSRQDLARAEGAARQPRSSCERRRALAVLSPPQHQSQKKMAHAAEQSRPDILKRRERWLRSSLISSPSAWCSSARPRPQPTWRDASAGRRPGSGCAWAFRTGIGKRRRSLPGGRTGMVAPFVLGGQTRRRHPAVIPIDLSV